MGIGSKKWKNQAMKKRTKRAVVYMRESGRHAGDSVAAQLKAIRRYARQHGLKIVKEATDGES